MKEEALDTLELKIHQIPASTIYCLIEAALLTVRQRGQNTERVAMRRQKEKQIEEMQLRIQELEVREYSG
jgi:hypothetical protein